MKVCFIQGHDLRSTETRISINVVEKLREYDIEVLINECHDNCDLLVSINGLSHYDGFEQIRKIFPYIKTVMYVWDLYPWTQYTQSRDGLREYDEIWVPSNEVLLRLVEFYNVDLNKCKVIKAYAEIFEAEEDQIKNNKFAYHPVRKYKDPNIGFTDTGSLATDITMVRSEHKLTYEEYKEQVLSCSFLVTEYHEASTGGLTLLEGYYHGKDVLLSDSKYQGGKDYFQDRAFYFKDGDIDDFIEKYKFLYERSFNYKLSDYELAERKQFIKDNYTIDVMAKNIYLALKELNG
jgi:glycosyltransferase involved in cell wall biosynthesis